jgi:RsiW-degrading membrane proteinase PrsW (M82 family)
MDDRELVEDDPGETEEQRERYRELLEELRTVMPGTQVLFAFLLTAVFSQTFGDLDDLGKRWFAAALLLAALAAVVLMAPGAFHRMSKPGKRPERLKVSVVMQIAGMALLLASMTVVVFVVVRQIFDDTTTGLVFAAIVGGVGIGLWYVLPRLIGLNRDD